MDTMIVTVFEDEAAAFEAWRALQDLDANGDIFLYGMAVVNKDANKVVKVKHAFAPSPEGTAAGMVVGGALGLVGGPVGVAVGAATGALAGSLFDVAHVGFDADYMDEVSAALEPGTTALVAEVDEGWTTPVDSRMQALGGRVARSNPADRVDAQIEADLTAMDAELTQAETELAQATAEAKAEVQARVNADKAKLQAARERAEARIEALRQEADAKVTAVQAQAKTAQAERKAKLEARAAEIRADYDRRIATLQQASALRQEAGKLTREALKP